MSEQEGRELDAVIAEKVMGFKLGEEPVGDEIHEVYRAPNGRGYYHYQIPPYSTSIAAAWEVVSKMGLVLIENSGDAFGQPDEWNVQFIGHDKEGEPHWVSASASTVELAICLAALKAVKSPP